MTSRLVSIVVPVYFEQECIEQFIKETTDVLVAEKINYEIVFVDDGSTDRTIDLITAAAVNNTRLKLVELSYNHGKQGALTAGFSHAKGDLLIMMDPDLQDPPVEIPRLISEIDKGYDLVFGIRAQKKDLLLNRLFSKVFWWLLERFTGLKIPTGLAVMRIFNRAFLERFLAYKEQNRFIEGIFMHVGMRRNTIVVSQRERFAGVSKYNFRRKLDLAFTAILDFSDLPLRVTMRFGGILVAFGMLSVCALLVLRIADVPMQLGWPSVVATLIIGFGAQIFFTGIVGQYVGRIYRETKQRPLFSVRRLVNIDATKANNPNDE